ncbi:hypothetical protein Taiwan894_04060 [Helicobacter pylori]
MKLYKRVLKLHQFRNLGKNLPTELLLNSSFEKHGELVILVGENNVGKSNILEALKAFNDTDIKLCNEKDYFKAHEFEDAVLSLEEETSRNNETIDFSCVDLKIQTKEIGEGLKELSKTLIVYPFEKHVEALEEQCKDMKYMMCQFYLKQIDLLANSEIEQYRYSDFFESARKSLWENIKTLDEKSGVHLFPKNIDEIKQKFEANKEKFQQSKNYSEFAKYCRECNPYTAFQGLRNRVNFPLKNHSLDKFVPTMKEYKELKITDNDLKTALLTRLDYSSPSEFESDWFFRNSLFRKMDFHPNTIWNTFGKILNYKNFDQKNLKYERALEIMFDKNNDLEVYSML